MEILQNEIFDTYIRMKEQEIKVLWPTASSSVTFYAEL